MPIRSRTIPGRIAEPPAATYAAAGDLLDLNVWLALAVDGHVHSARARSYWREEAAGAAAVCFCRHTMLGFLRLLTQPKLMGKAVCTAAQALGRYDALLALPEVEMFPEPPGCDESFREYARSPQFLPRLWTDAYLAAFARTAGLRLVTFDADFRRFDGLEPLVLN